MKLSLIDKIRLLGKLNATEKDVEEGIRMKNSTKILGAVISLLALIVQMPGVQAALMGYVNAHPAVALALGGISALLALVHVPVKQTVNVLLAAAVVLGLTCAPSLHAQQIVDPPAVNAPLQNIYAAGVSYNVNGTPAVSGTGLYARLLSADTGTYAFTAIDALPNTVKPFTVTTNIGAGVAQKVFTLGSIPVYVPTAAGISFSGSNTGWQWNAGALASIHIKGSYYLMPSVRLLKSSVGNGSGYQPIIGVLVGWGK